MRENASIDITYLQMNLACDGLNLAGSIIMLPGLLASVLSILLIGWPLPKRKCGVPRVPTSHGSVEVPCLVVSHKYPSTLSGDAPASCHSDIRLVSSLPLADLHLREVGTWLFDHALLWKLA